MSAFSRLASVAPQPIWHGVVGRAVHGERVTLSVIELDADCEIPEHAHENEQVGLLVSGSLTFRVGAETREIGPGETWCIAANVPHEVRTGPDGAVAFEVFCPVREDWKTIEPAEPAPPRWPEP